VYTVRTSSAAAPAAHRPPAPASLSGAAPLPRPCRGAGDRGGGSGRGGGEGLDTGR
jgi:hypothetical protein